MQNVRAGNTGNDFLAYFTDTLFNYVVRVYDYFFILKQKKEQ